MGKMSSVDSMDRTGPEGQDTVQLFTGREDPMDPFEQDLRVLDSYDPKESHGKSSRAKRSRTRRYAGMIGKIFAAALLYLIVLLICRRAYVVYMRAPERYGYKYSEEELQPVLEDCRDLYYFSHLEELLDLKETEGDSDETMDPGDVQRNEITVAALEEAYAATYLCYAEHREWVVTPVHDRECMRRIHRYVMADHPEIFCVQDSKLMLRDHDGVRKVMCIGAEYDLDKEACDQARAQIDSYVAKAMAGRPKSTDPYETVRYFYEYLIRHTDYQLDAKYNQDIRSVMIERETVCQGYAKSFQYLLTLAGIEATYVIGTVGEEPHGWNLVRLGGDWYYVDVTWGDPIYREEDPYESVGQRHPESWGFPTDIDYGYLLVNSDILFRTHKPGDLVSVPVCDSMEQNYHVRCGAYFTGWDEVQFERCMEKAIQSEEKVLSLRCADRTIYDQMREYLLDEQKIFSYLDIPKKQITYWDDPNQYVLTFWL